MTEEDIGSQSLLPRETHLEIQVRLPVYGHKAWLNVMRSVKGMRLACLLLVHWGQLLL